MSLAARKSDVRSHLSRTVKRHYLSPDSTNGSEQMVAAEEGDGANLSTSISDVDSGQRSSSAGVYAPNEVTAQH
jgi:hypothetical protein